MIIHLYINKRTFCVLSGVFNVCTKNGVCFSPPKRHKKTEILLHETNFKNFARPIAFSRSFKSSSHLKVALRLYPRAYRAEALVGVPSRLLRKTICKLFVCLSSNLINIFFVCPVIFSILCTFCPGGP